jgi:hypothetical protein
MTRLKVATLTSDCMNDSVTDMHATVHPVALARLRQDLVNQYRTSDDRSDEESERRESSDDDSSAADDDAAKPGPECFYRGTSMLMTCSGPLNVGDKRKVLPAQCYTMGVCVDVPKVERNNTMNAVRAQLRTSFAFLQPSCPTVSMPHMIFCVSNVGARHRVCGLRVFTHSACCVRMTPRLTTRRGT